MILDLNNKNSIFESAYNQMMHNKAKPFVKWAGGKSSLLSQLDSWLPHEFLNSGGVTYVEPFVGGGALLFHLLQQYPSIQKVIINDINEDLINCYRAIKDVPNKLINKLSKIEKEFYHLGENERKEYYYSIRQDYNSRRSDSLVLASYFIFLNHTCFNGLYRVNSHSGFNVPYGKNENVKICNKELLLADHTLFNRLDMTILCGSYESVITQIDDHEKTFVYLDPPYLPISVTSYFKQYSNSPFGTAEQVVLKQFCDSLTEKGCRFMLSNSDCKTEDGGSYFEQLYNGYDCHTVNAKRFISAQGDRRRNTTEVLIRNYSDGTII